MAAIPTPKTLLLTLSLLFSLSQLHSTLAALYKVGDYSGKWGTDNYFQAGDLLSFVHHTKSAAVHQVNREDYKVCETEKPIRTYRDDNNVAHLKEQSTYYFISGSKSQCKEGRKLMVVVLAAAPGSTSPASSPVSTTTPPPSAPPPPAVAVTPSTPPSVAPSSTPPSAAPVSPPSAPAPAVAATPPSAAPASPPPSSSPTPTAITPSTAVPSPSTTSPSPATAPSSVTGPPGPPLPSTSGPATPPANNAAFLGAMRLWMVVICGLCNGLGLL